MQSLMLRDDQSRSPEEQPRPDRPRSDCPVLLSQRLVLRAPHIEDIDALAHLANNAAIATMVARMPHPYTAKDAADFVRRTNIGEIGKCVYAITKADNGEFLGCCALEPHQHDEALELGYWLGQPYWNKGYGTEAAHALIDMAFRTRDIAHHLNARLGGRVIAAEVDPDALFFQF